MRIVTLITACLLCSSQTLAGTPTREALSKKDTETSHKGVVFVLPPEPTPPPTPTPDQKFYGKCILSVEQLSKLQGTGNNFFFGDGWIVKRNSDRTISKYTKTGSIEITSNDSCNSLNDQNAETALVELIKDAVSCSGCAYHIKYGDRHYAEALYGALTNCRTEGRDLEQLAQQIMPNERSPSSATSPSAKK